MLKASSAMEQAVRLLKIAPAGAVRQENSTISKLAMLEDVFTPEECARIVDMGNALPDEIGIIDTGQSAGSRSIENIRKSLVKFLTPDADNDWVFDRIEQLLMQVNQTYRFELYGFFEGAQIATYTEGGHYKWHIDVGSELSSNRKLSVTIQLTDPAEYEGGGLEFMNVDQTTTRAIGSLIVFPSFLMHRVLPVTRGTRQSMVTWISGPPFR